MEIKRDIGSKPIDATPTAESTDSSAENKTIPSAIGDTPDSIEPFQGATDIDQASAIGSRTVSLEDQMTVRTFYEEGWNKGDPKAFVGHPQIAAECQRQMDHYRQLFPDLKIHVNSLEQHNDEVVVRWTAQGTPATAFQTSNPSPVQENVDGLTKMKIQNGEITWAKAAWDDRALQNLIGGKISE